MAKNTESEATDFFQFEVVADSKPKSPSLGIKLVQGIVALGTFAVVVAMFSAGVVWIVNRTPKASAASERERLDEQYYDWTKEPGRGVKGKR